MEAIPHIPLMKYIKLVQKHLPFMPDFGEDVRKQYGDIATYRRGLTKYYFIGKPEWAQQILRGDYKGTVKPPTYDVLKPHMGDGPVTSEGEKWVRQRRLSAPAFMKLQLDRSIPFINSEIQKSLDLWSKSAASEKSVNISEDLNHLTFRILCGVILGGNLEKYRDDLYAEILNMVELVPQKSFSLIKAPFWIPTPFNRVFNASAKRYRTVIHEILKNADTESQSAGMISHLIKKNGKFDTDTVDILATMISAGFETTANAISWILALLTEHPEKQQKLRSEIQKAIGDAPLDAQNIFSIPYVEWVIDEALRMYPPALYPSRLLKDGVDLDGIIIPKGGVVEMSIWQLHRRPDYWEKPNDFIPERFSPEKFGPKQEAAFVPFAVGPRECVGKKLALYELQLMLTQIVRQFELHPGTGFMVKPHAAMLLRPEKGVNVRFVETKNKNLGQADLAQPLH